jgi:hypothetical protein
VRAVLRVVDRRAAVLLLRRRTGRGWCSAGAAAEVPVQLRHATPRDHVIHLWRSTGHQRIRQTTRFNCAHARGSKYTSNHQVPRMYAGNFFTGGGPQRFLFHQILIINSPNIKIINLRQHVRKSGADPVAGLI